MRIHTLVIVAFVLFMVSVPMHAAEHTDEQVAENILSSLFIFQHAKMCDTRFGWKHSNQFTII